MLYYIGSLRISNQLAFFVFFHVISKILTSSKNNVII
jgi:hypothetical protein